MTEIKNVTDSIKRKKNASPINTKVKNVEIQSKVFESRESPLTNLLKIKDFKTVYHIFIFMLITFFINTFVYDYVKNGKIILGLDVITSAFGKFYIVIFIWIIMFTFSLLCYGTLVQWAKLRIKMAPKGSSASVLDTFGIVMTIFYHSVLLYLPTKLMLYYNLPVISSSVVLAEQIRMVMKSHAFIRDTSAKVLRYKSHADMKQPYPTFGHYLYFLFVPTMVYRDEYPRTKVIRWSYVVKCFLEVISTIFYICFVMDNFYLNQFQHICKLEVELIDIVLRILLNTLPALLVILCGFYCLLHAWMNGFAEMLRFADRQFYQDWWNSTTYARYYRTWNTVVHDWLHTYIYKDLFENVFVGNRVACKLMVFLISAIVHEYIISFMLGFFFPVLFIKFSTFGVVLTFINKESVVGNIFMWYSLAMGFSSVLSLYTIEYYARVNCPTAGNYQDYFIPRFLTCSCF